jgi:hypothetical protein
LLRARVDTFFTLRRSIAHIAVFCFVRTIGSPDQSLICRGGITATADRILHAWSNWNLPRQISEQFANLANFFCIGQTWLLTRDSSEEGAPLLCWFGIDFFQLFAAKAQQYILKFTEKNLEGKIINYCR